MPQVRTAYLPHCSVSLIGRNMPWGVVSVCAKCHIVKRILISDRNVFEGTYTSLKELFLKNADGLLQDLFSLVKIGKFITKCYNLNSFWPTRFTLHQCTFQEYDLINERLPWLWLGGSSGSQGFQSWRLLCPDRL